jgi:hypothetical protein
LSDSSNWSAPAELGQLERRAWLIGGAALALSIVGALLDRDQFVHSYLVAWLLWVGVAFGCFAVMALHHMSRGAWGLMIRRVLESVTKTIPLLGVLSLPVLLSLPSIYKWARPEEVAGNPILEQKIAYLNQPFFIGRTVFYFALLGGLGWLLTKRSLKQDRTGDPALFRRMQTIAGPSLGLYVLVATFASIDWIMSLDPLWYSSLFGVYFVGGHGVSAFAFVIPVALWLSQREPMSRAFRQRHFHDYGKLLLAFVMLWAYFALSQLLIIWSGNVAEFAPWYLERVHGGWKYLGILLGVVHFFFPFLLLLSRDLKRDARRLAIVALLLLVMRWVDLYWQVGPAFHHEGFTLHWLDATTVIGLGGVWFAVVLRLLAKHPLVPINDPYLEEALPGE